MPCFKPLSAWQLENGTIVFAERGKIRRVLTLPCSQCIGCRLERSRRAAVRIVHESKQHNANCFLTLTLDDEHLTNKYFTGQYDRFNKPVYAGTLEPRDTQLFFKKLRRQLQRNHTKAQLCRTYVRQPLYQGENKSLGKVESTTEPQPIRYYLGAEYGPKYRRPHYHVCLFGLEFADMKYHSQSPAGEKLYRSPTLEKLWPNGYSTIGELNFLTAAYTARYVVDKITGQQAEKHYTVLNHETGEIIKLKQEYCNSSQGIGKTAFNKWHQDWYPEGKVVIRGKESNTPRYYDQLYAKYFPEEYEVLEYQRYLEGVHNVEEHTDARLAVREQVTNARIQTLKRKLG